MNPRVKKIVIGVVVVVVAGIGAVVLGNRATPTEQTGLNSNRVDGPINTNPVASTGTVNDEFFSTLLSIRSIRIDTSLFKNPAFTYLKDNPVLLGTDVQGRPNPFSPIGVDPVTPHTSTTVGSTSVPVITPTSGTGTTTSSSAGVQTVQPGKVTATSAELAASVAFPPGTGPALISFEYGVNQNSLSPTEAIIIDNGGTTTLPLTGLTPGTKYYVRASLVYGTQTLYGSTMNFTTLLR